MPTYEYLCESCGHRFEVLQHITDAPLATCPNCSGHIHRVLFPAGIVFKGSGFYKTDSRGTSTAATPAPVAHEPGAATSSDKTEKSATTETSKTESTAPAATETTSTSGTSASN
ncbi:MAG: FmdB family zinc ribbon protein [Nitrososphaerota archaeon]